MTYRVVVQRLALRDLDDAYRWAAKQAPETASRWLNRFEQAIASLGEHPERCPLARESAKTELEIRDFLFGHRPNVFRVIFTIEAKTVRILRIRSRSEARAERRADPRRR